VRRAVLLAACLGLALTGCSSADDSVPGPGPAKVSVDDPDLAAVKERIGMADCAPGPGGGALPAVTLPCLGGGRSVDLSSLRGPMVISFWAAWCEECRVEMPVLQDFHDRYAEEVPLLGIDWVDQYPGSALELAGETGATYPSLADPGGDLQETSEFAKVSGLPYLVLLDEDGEIAHAEFGVVESVDELVGLVDDHLGVAL
jgi:thiol-disulfide isomerase/thioredoxin